MARKAQYRKGRFQRVQWGGTLAELALILPMFLLMIFATLDLGRAVWSYNTLSNATREGLRYAIVRGSMNPSPASASDIRQAVINQAGGLNPANLTVTTTWTPDNKPGSTVRVQGQYNFSFVAPLLNFGTITLTSAASMVIAY